MTRDPFAEIRHALAADPTGTIDDLQAGLRLDPRRADRTGIPEVVLAEHKGVGEAPVLHKEPLEFEYVKLTQRSYK